MKTVILISGKAKSGKDTLCSFMMKYLSSLRITAFHDYISRDMKDQCSQDMHQVAKYLWSVANEINSIIESHPETHYNTHRLYPEYFQRAKDALAKIRIIPESWYDKKTDLSRIMLQVYGTEIFQNRVDVNYWDKKCRERIEKSDAEFVIVTDVRFESNIDELCSSDKYKPVLIRIEGGKSIKSNHKTETSLDDYKHWDYIVDNNGTLETLSFSARSIIDEVISNERAII
jgi:hypothetical protein